MHGGSLQRSSVQRMVFPGPVNLNPAPAVTRRPIPPARLTPAVSTILLHDQAQGVDLLPRAPLETDRDLAVARDVAGAPALLVAKPRRAIRVGRVEPLPVDLHE